MLVDVPPYQTEIYAMRVSNDFWAELTHGEAKSITPVKTIKEVYVRSRVTINEKPVYRYDREQYDG